jgi:Fic family protein
MYIRKEAVLSSQIEGTQSTLDDLLRYEATASAGAPVDDLQEVSNYIAAMQHGLARLANVPLSLRLIREMHAKLLRGGRGGTKQSGEFRTTQNWIGGTRPGNATFVPPPPQEVMPSLGEFETFLHQTHSELPTLIKAGLIHVQFETIHPFLDGNGRIGRLLITLYLYEQSVLQRPLLYLSLYFKQHRKTYYDLLQAVRERGAWEHWLEYFLDAIASTATLAIESANRIVELLREDRALIKQQSDTPNSALRVHEIMQTKPYLSAPLAQIESGLTAPTINSVLEQLSRLGVVSEITGKRRNRVYAYRRYLDILEDVAPARRETAS